MDWLAGLYHSLGIVFFITVIYALVKAEFDERAKKRAQKR